MREDGSDRRTRKKDIRTYYNPAQVFEILQRDTWDYKINIEFFHARDLALGSLLYLTSGRINEILRILINQFQLFEEDKDFLMLKNLWVSKRRKRHSKVVPIPIRSFTGEIERYEKSNVIIQASDNPIIDIPMSFVGKLGPFTKAISHYLNLMEDKDKEKLFPFKEPRAWQIINHITGGRDDTENGFWPHWFRAQSLSYFVNLLRSTTIVAKERGIANPATIQHYYIALWEEHREELKA